MVIEFLKRKDLTNFFGGADGTETESNLPSYDGYHKIFDRIYGIVERRFEFEVHEVLETVFQ